MQLWLGAELSVVVATDEVSGSMKTPVRGQSKILPAYCSYTVRGVTETWHASTDWGGVSLVVEEMLGSSRVSHQDDI